MLYRITRSVVRLGIRGFFNQIESSGSEQLNAPSPTIIIANHPSALMDPLVIATITDRKLHFLAAAEYFGSGLQKTLLEKEFKMIPVYRPQMYEGEEVSNEDMFRDCYKCLDKNGCIVIFPEGNSVTEKHLRPLKTGTARILMGFKKAFPDKHVNIIPMGLNYSNAHNFQSKVFVSVGSPVVLPELIPGSLEFEKKQINQITGLMHNSLKNEILHFENKHLESLINKVDKIWRNQLHEDLSIAPHDEVGAFRAKQKVIRAADQLYQKNPAIIEKFHEKVDDYLNALSKQKLKPEIIDRKASERSIMLSKLLLGLPLFLAGMAINMIPYQITKYLFLHKYLPKVTSYEAKEGLSPAFIGTLSYSIGMVIFLVWLMTFGVFLSLFTYWWAGLLFFFGAYYLGRFCLNYSGWFTGLKRILAFSRQRKKLGDKYQLLIKQRQSLINELFEFKSNFDRDQVESGSR